MEKITETYAWAKQDIFVAEILKGKMGGTYVEIGSNEPLSGSNTYLLEKEFKWTGLSIDIDPKYVEQFNSIRNNKSILADATTFNYLKYFEENNFPKQIDYLSIDVDGNFQFDGTKDINSCLLSLISLPLTTYRFTVIHYEHDSWMYQNKPSRDAQREILTSLGYSIIMSGLEEDWWLDTTVIDWQTARKFFHFRDGHYEVISE